MNLLDKYIVRPLKEFFKSESVKKTLYADVIISNSEGKVLLLHRSYNGDFEPGKWSWPGGHVEKNEETAIAAIRETKEETGLNVSVRAIDVLELQDCIIYYYEGYVTDNKYEVILDEEEHRNYEWVDRREIQNYSLVCDLNEYVNDLLGVQLIDAPTPIQTVDEAWQTIVKAFDDELIDATQYFKAREQYHRAKIVESLNTIEKGFNDGLIEESQYLSVVEQYPSHFLEKGGKPAVLGEKRLIGGRWHIKTTDGWKYYGDGSGRKAMSYEKVVKTPTPGPAPIPSTKEVLAEVHEALEFWKERAATSTGMGKTIAEGWIEHYEEKLGIKKETAVAATIEPFKMPELDLTTKVSAGGSGGAYIVKGKDGEKYIRKEQDGTKNIPDQLRQEQLADDIYRIMGIGAAEGALTEGASTKVSKFIEGAKNLGSVSGTLYNTAKKSLQKGFVLDCLLLNWDVIGAGKDNVVVNESGEAFRIDNGGSLLYRAKNGEKPESALTEEVKEIDVFRSDKNPTAKEIFGDISEEEIKRQVAEIVGKKVDILEHIIDSEITPASRKEKIRSLIQKRIDWLDKTYNGRGVKAEKSGSKEKEEAKPKEKHSYASDVTNEYFKKWDSVTLEGNPTIKDGIKKHIQEVEKSNEDAYEIHAKKRGVSVEEYKKLLQKKVEELVSKSDFFRATDIKVLDLILNKDKRFKSQFETDTSHGSLSPSSRAAVENTYFDFPNKVGAMKEQRPIYGYFSDNPNGVINGKGEVPPPNETSMYGAVTIKVKRESAMRKVTVAFHDTLGYSSGMACTPASHPHFTSLQCTEYTDPLKIDATHKMSSYTECQYHNQLTLDDLEAVHISPYSKSYSDKPDYDLLNKTFEIARKTHLPVKVFGNK